MLLDYDDCPCGCEQGFIVVPTDTVWTWADPLYSYEGYANSRYAIWLSRTMDVGLAAIAMMVSEPLWITEV